MTSVTVAIAFHNERELARYSIRSVLRSMSVARERGIDAQMLATLDRSDECTRTQIADELAGNARLITADFGDLAMSRNLAIDSSDADYLLLTDGDDIVSDESIWRYVECARDSADPSIFHPESIFYFGKESSVQEQISSRDPRFNPDILAVMNPWISSCFARRDVFIKHPYLPMKRNTEGFGFEDWQWNGRTLFSGIHHEIVKDLAHFVRVKESGSLNQSQRNEHVLPDRMGMRVITE